MKVLSLKRERLNFDELASKMETVSREEQKVHIGGGDGSPNSPYTYSEYDEKESNGSWAGGYVVGMGYVAGTAYCYGSGGSGYSSGYGRSTNYNLNDLWWVQQKNDYYYSQNIYGTTPSSSSNNFQNYNGGSSSQNADTPVSVSTFSGVSAGYGINGVLENYNISGTTTIRGNRLWVGAEIKQALGSYPDRISSVVEVYLNNKLTLSVPLSKSSSAYITKQGWYPIGETDIDLPTGGYVKVLLKTSGIFNHIEGNTSALTSNQIYYGIR